MSSTSATTIPRPQPGKQPIENTHGPQPTLKLGHLLGKAPSIQDAKTKDYQPGGRHSAAGWD